jgi:hypothetical protein
MPSSKHTWAVLATALFVGLVLAWAVTRRMRRPASPGVSQVGASVADRQAARDLARRDESSPVPGVGSPAPREQRDHGMYASLGRPQDEKPVTPAARVHAEGGRSAQEIYADEPRQDAWASQRGAELLAYAKADVLAVDPDAKLDVDCRTSSCKIRLQSNNKLLNARSGNYPFACMGSYTTADLEQRDPAHPDVLFADIYILFGDENLDHDAFSMNRDQTCEKYREKWLEYVRKHQTGG